MSLKKTLTTPWNPKISTWRKKKILGKVQNGPTQTKGSHNQSQQTSGTTFRKLVSKFRNCFHELILVLVEQQSQPQKTKEAPAMSFLQFQQQQQQLLKKQMQQQKKQQKKKNGTQQQPQPQQPAQKPQGQWLATVVQSTVWLPFLEPNLVL